jgi:hypothetical protein
MAALALTVDEAHASLMGIGAAAREGFSLLALLQGRAVTPMVNVCLSMCVVGIRKGGLMVSAGGGEKEDR